MDIYERIKSAVKWLIGQGIATNQENLGLLLGYSNKSSFSQVLNGKKPLPANFLERLAGLHDRLNLEWLETGRGEMTTSDAVAVPQVDYMYVPLVPISAQAGYPSGYGDEEYINDLPTLPIVVDKQYKGKYRVFEVSGDSMDDGSRNALCDKDKVLCREVRRELWQYKLHIKDWYFVIVHRTEGVTLKQITEHNTETGEVHCHPLNSMFKDFSLNLDEVAELYNVIRIIDRNTRI